MYLYPRTHVAPADGAAPSEFDGWITLRPDTRFPSLKDLCVARLCSDSAALDKVAPARVQALPRELQDLFFEALFSNRLLTDHSLLFFKNPQVKSLDLSLCNLITENGLRILQQDLSNITTLYLNRCEWVVDGTCSLLAANTHVRHLYLSGCEITDEGVSKLVKHTGLLTLDISHCKSVKAQSLKDISRKLESLTHLDVSWLDHGVADKAYRKLKHNHKLQYLNLGDAMISDGTLAKLLSACPELRTLDISFCSALTDGVVAKLGKSGMGLKQLLFAKAPFDDNDVHKICSTLTKLELLDLSWSPKLTDACLTKLSKMKSLTTFNVTFTNLSRAAISTAVQENPQIQNFYHWGLKKPAAGHP